MTFRTFFTELTALEPYPYQEAVSEAILSRRNLVLRAPTGAGKTWAAVTPFLYSLSHGPRIADRLLYTLPLRSLATSLYLEVKTRVERLGLPLSVRIQTGEQRDDPFWEADVTFTTIDQLLSGYLMNPLSLPPRVGNINAGALIGSLVVFDEYHLLEPAKSMATSIEMLNRLTANSPLAQFVLMTATLSSATTRWLAGQLKAQITELDEQEVAALPSHADKRRVYRWIEQPLTAQQVVAQHGGGRSIVLLNTVRRAQELYAELTSTECRANLGDNTRIALLHSRFFSEDRARVESKLMDWFGPSATLRDVILVTTQVIEAGMDLSSDNLHTELAPVNALIQRAGRCARRKGEAGTVWVYDLLTTAAGDPLYGPYRDAAECVVATRNVLVEQVAGDGRPCGYHDELAWVDAVHTERELRELAPMNSLHAHRKLVHEAMDGVKKNATRELVRDVDSVNIVITARPETLRFDRDQWPRMLSVPLYALDPKSDDADWVAKEAVEDDVTQDGALKVTWTTVTSKSQFATPWVIAVNPRFATYDAQLGLRIGVGGPDMEPQYRDRSPMPRYQYRYETYVDHVTRVARAAADQAGQYATGRELLSRALRVSAEQIESWTNLTCLLHDVGKLSRGWQDAIWAWQEYKDMSAQTTRSEREPLAHSDFDPETDGQHQRSFQARPPHAAEGAYAVVPWLRSPSVRPSARAILTAVTRHHGTWVERLGDFELLPDAESLVRQMLPAGDWPGPLFHSRQKTSAESDFGRNLLAFRDSTSSESWPLYVFLVRRLRLADQMATRQSSSELR